MDREDNRKAINVARRFEDGPTQPTVGYEGEKAMLAKTSPLQDEHMRQDGLLHELQTTLSILEDKLAPVLSQDGDKFMGGEIAGPVNFSSDIVRTTFTNNSRIADVIDRVRSITRRVEV